MTCKSKNLVYLISCRRCEVQYVGETEQALRLRMNEHRSDIQTKKIEKPVAAHFCQEDHSQRDLEVTAMEKSITTTHKEEKRERVIGFLHLEPWLQKG